jgi:peptidoglycan/xylan/chitin deacetylase (PgdA/CDA1 family)
MKYYDTYKEIKSLKHIGIRGHMRTFALNAISIIERIKRVQNDLNRNRVQFLYIHHVFKDEEKKLDVLLKQLALNHSFISYSNAVDKILNRTIDKSYIAISSDDGFKNNLRAAEILDNNGAKACFFINPKIIGISNYETIKTFCRVRLKFPPVEFLNWKDVELLQKMGHEIGSHTMEHINIAKSSTESIIEDCSKSFEILKYKCGDVKHFAFPYGRFIHFNEIGRKAVFANGFVSCASAERGCHVNPDKKILNEELCILRDHVLLDWNINHVLYFLANNSRKASPQNNYFPYKS